MKSIIFILTFSIISYGNDLSDLNKAKFDYSLNLNDGITLISILRNAFDKGIKEVVKENEKWKVATKKNEIFITCDTKNDTCVFDITKIEKDSELGPIFFEILKSSQGLSHKLKTMGEKSFELIFFDDSVLPPNKSSISCSQIGNSPRCYFNIRGTANTETARNVLADVMKLDDQNAKNLKALFDAGWTVRPNKIWIYHYSLPRYENDYFLNFSVEGTVADLTIPQKKRTYSRWGEVQIPLSTLNVKNPALGKPAQQKTARTLGFSLSENMAIVTPF